MLLRKSAPETGYWASTARTLSSRTMMPTFPPVSPVVLAYTLSDTLSSFMNLMDSTPPVFKIFENWMGLPGGGVRAPP